jgi:phosphate transport system substrate-binding protein
MEYQAILLARSKLYGTLALSASDIFLALAAEIPDPENPGALIRNPNTTWDRVNGSLPREPIEVFGPSAQSMTAIAFRETLLEAGCNAFPAIAALKQTDQARHEQVCKTLRKDGAYVEMREESPTDILQSLQSHPNAIGVLGYGLLRESSFKDNYMLITNPIGGVEATRETISNGTYPGSRTLYLYINQRRASSNAPYFISWLVENSAYAESFCVVPIDAEPLKATRKYPVTLPDLKM